MSDLHDSDETVIVECELPEPPEKVWRALTEPELVAEWLAPDEGGAIDCEVIESQPNRLLRYSWRDHGDDEPDSAVDSIVTFELSRTPAGGTRLRIIHTGFEQMPAMAMAA
jgi:uncharacterized protein YndB with AHSA1/START domain